ncbi:MAG TPA: FAD-dependent oxidoreductase [Symbiobacteriaceae bacterium]|nr:FAD-dependent oxidoreductase [Symbiobacteriaceae bacterium]
MYTYMTNCTQLPEVDVLVVGGGSAGATAAIAAARQGARVALIERYGFLGGTGAMVLDTFYGFYTPGDKSRKVVGGIPDEVVDRLTAEGAAMLRPNTYGAGTGVTYDPELLKVIWEELVTEAGVQLLLHTICLDVLREDGAVCGAILGNKAGIFAIRAKVMVDASGDADAAAKAGAPFEPIGRDEQVQSLTTTFRLCNVDVERAKAVNKQELWDRMKAANQSGKYRLPREDGSVHITTIPGFMATNMVRISVPDPTDPLALSQAEVEGRRQALEYARFLRECVPGYERSQLATFSTQIGVRETRRIYGEYRLTREDVLDARRFPDAVAQCGAPIEDHHAGAGTHWEYVPDGGTYDIPYRCLVPRLVDGLLVAGRCLSATHAAHASVRSIAQCMAMGQAAGAAAALAARTGTAPRHVDTGVLRQHLVKLGAVLEGGA